MQPLIHVFTVLMQGLELYIILGCLPRTVAKNGRVGCTVYCAKIWVALIKVSSLSSPPNANKGNMNFQYRGAPLCFPFLPSNLCSGDYPVR